MTIKNEEIVEEFAAMEHTRWSKWQEYLHSKCTKNSDGSLTIPAYLVTHWERQISTPYSQLSEPEKEADRREVRPYIEYAQRLTTRLDAEKEEAVKAARKEWLREEIAKLRVMQLQCTKCQNGYTPLGHREDGEIEWGGCEDCVVSGVYQPAYEEHNKALQTIIDRYQSELENQ